MNTFCDTLNKLLVRRFDYCCLCMKSIDETPILVQDEIVVDKTYKTEEIIEILSYLLNSEIVDSLLPNNAICRDCKKSAIQSYNFIKMCKENFERLNKSIASISESLTSANFFFPCNTLFVSLNTTDFYYQLHHDVKKPVSSLKAALKRYNLLQNKKEQWSIDSFQDYDSTFTPKVLFENEIVSQTVKSKECPKKPKAKSRLIPTSGMMYDEKSYKCKSCMKTYPSSQHLRQHYFRMHAPKKFKCTECPRSYGTQGLLDQHKNDSHTPVICIECGKTYQNKHSLKVHELGHKTKIICPDCGRTYKNRRTFNKHIALNICQQRERKSNLEAKFICDYCNKKFSHKPTLRVHIQFEHGNGKAHVCPWCSKKFYAQSRLKAHVVKHTQEKKFTCELCGGKFVTKESLLYHTRIHTGERPYQCHLCDSTFLSSSRRSEHIRRHHMSPSWECEICHNKFKGRSCLVKHKKRHLDPKSRLHCSEKVTELSV